MTISEAIQSLVDYAVNVGLVEEADRIWATNKLLEVMELYENYPDDGRLKFFSFGVHSIDFERNATWGDLEAFSEKYGNRLSDYYYASVADILEYEDAVKALAITENEIYNPSTRTLYMKLDGREVILGAGERIAI